MRPEMKKEARQARILDIIARQSIGTQEELTRALQELGIHVTQATVSRDIKELMLLKVPTEGSGYRYVYPRRQEGELSGRRMGRLLQDFVTGMDSSENIIVLRTLPHAAGIVASALEAVGWEDVIGIVAGDGNILLVVKPKEAVPSVMERLGERGQGA